MPFSVGKGRHFGAIIDPHLAPPIGLCRHRDRIAATPAAHLPIQKDRSLEGSSHKLGRASLNYA